MTKEERSAKGLSLAFKYYKESTCLCKNECDLNNCNRRKLWRNYVLLRNRFIARVRSPGYYRELKDNTYSTLESSPVVSNKRSCLGCDITFLSRGSHNRLCSMCNERIRLTKINSRSWNAEDKRLSQNTDD